MPSELTTIEKTMLAELLVCGALDREEYFEVTRIPQRGTGMRDQTMKDLRKKGVLQETLYRGDGNGRSW